MNHRLKDRHIGKQAIFIFLLVFAMLAGMYVIGKNSFHLVNSDDAAEMILAKLLSEENRFISRGWIYSSELRVINTQIVRELIFKFTDNWVAVRVVGNFLLYLWLLAAYGFFIWQWKVGKNWFWYTAPLLLIPFSHEAFYVIGLMAYYIPHIAFSLLLCGGWMYLYQRGKYQRGMRIFVIACAFLSCLGGIRQLAMTILPMLMTMCVLFLEHAHRIKGLKELIVKYDFIWTSALSGFLGYFVNLKVLSRWYLFDSYGGIHLCQPHFDRLQVVLRGILNAFGYTEEGVPDTELFSVNGIFYLLSLGFLFLVLFMTITLWKQRRKLKLMSQALLWFSLLGLLIQLFLFLFTDAPFAPRYYILNVIMFVPLLIIFYQEAEFPLWVRQTFFVLVVACVCMLGGKEYANCLNSQKNKGQMECVSYLKEENYSLGYASFWNANLITELTGGKVEIVSIACEEGEEPHLYPWLTKLNNLFPDKEEGPVFLLLHENELRRYEALISNGEQAFYDGQYYIYQYEKAEELLSILQ